jgi:hypothetical protein
MEKYYIKNGWINEKIRCVIKDELVNLKKWKVMNRKMFKVWVSESEVEKMSKRMIGYRFWDENIKNILKIWCKK